MDYEKEIPFGAFDSELMHQEIFIPEGFEATIEGSKVILKKIESEDEKIRKALVDALNKNLGNGIEKYGTTLNAALAWLEKQGEPTDINPSEFDLRLNKLLKQFEALPKEELASSLSFYLNVVQNNGTYKQGEQKPMTEEFEHELAEICNQLLSEIDSEWMNNEILNCIGTSVWLNLCDETAKRYKDGLLKLAKQGEQKPAEWGEEDEHRIKDTIYFLETAKKHYASTVELDACINRLKSIKERYTWKPSNAQIRALEYIIDNAHNTSYSCKIAKELLEQLRKLKGE